MCGRIGGHYTRRSRPKRRASRGTISLVYRRKPGRTASLAELTRFITRTLGQMGFADRARQSIATGRRPGSAVDRTRGLVAPPAPNCSGCPSFFSRPTAVGFKSELLSNDGRRIRAIERDEARAVESVSWDDSHRLSSKATRSWAWRGVEMSRSKTSPQPSARTGPRRSGCNGLHAGARRSAGVSPSSSFPSGPNEVLS